MAIPEEEMGANGTVYRIVEYHPYWQDRANNIRNPDKDRNTGRLLDLKDSSAVNHKASVKFFASHLATGLNNHFPVGRRFIGAAVPSHLRGGCSSGLHSLLVEAKGQYPNLIVPDSNVLIRTKDIEKLADGGDRSIDVHLDSIAVNPVTFVAGADYLLIDDVSTTENSLKACRKVLFDAGAKSVLVIAMGKTVR